MRWEHIVDRIDATGICWEWQGARSRGYGQVWAEDRTFYVHRLVYETLVGPIPDGLELDHLCRNPACCNPDHLQPVTRRENLARSAITPAAQRRARSACIHGHPYVGRNVILKRDGSRQCRECKNAASREATRRRRAA